MLGDLLQFLFVPQQETIDNLVNSVKSKFAFVDTVKETIVLIEDMFKNTETLPKLTLTLPENKWYNGQVTVIDLSWYSPYKQYGDTILSAFIYVFFIWRIYISLASIIAGTGGSINDTSIAISDIQAYNKHGFGRRESLTRRQR